MEASRAPRSRPATAVRPDGRIAVAILVLGVLGAVLLIAAEATTLVTVDVLTGGTCEELADPAARDSCKTTGLEQHGGALLLLGGLAIAMALGAARRQSRPAAVALLTVAGVVLALAILRDIPKTDETGPVGLRYEAAEANTGPALYLELAGAALCALAGTIRLTRSQETRAPEGQAP